MKKPREYLQDILSHIRAVADFTTGGYDDFLADLKTQFAVIRAYEIIGEAAKRLPAELRDMNPQIDWRKLISFRDFLAHNYDEIILEFVWQAVGDLPYLKVAVEGLLQSLDEKEAE